MTDPKAIKPTIPEVIERFAAYRQTHRGWGCMHLVLANPNYEDGIVRVCIQTAVEEGDMEGKALAEILLTMSKTQRKNLGQQCLPIKSRFGVVMSLPRDLLK